MGAGNAKFQAALAKKRLILFRKGKSLDPCDPFTAKLMRAINKYDKVLGEAITGRRSITIKDLTIINELLRGNVRDSGPSIRAR